MSDRDSLTSRTLPFMTLSDASDESMTTPPPPFPKDLSIEERARARFAVEGSVVITGGAGILGLSAARALLEHGASGCSLWDLEATLRSAQGQIAALAAAFPRARVLGVAVDVTDEAGVREAAAATTQALGGGGGSDSTEAAHLLCFAGVVGCHHAADMTAAQWRRTLDVNTTGAFLCAQAFARQLTARRARGSITLVASVSAHRVNFPQPQVAYNVSKAGLVALKASLAAEWAVHGIRVNSISPGYMDTILNAGGGTIAEARAVWASRNPMGRMGAVGELDGMCVLLASRAGSYINGADMVIDGGQTVF